jgi:hypothetical protein
MDNVIPFPFEKLSRKQPTAPRWSETASVVIHPLVRIAAGRGTGRSLEPPTVVKDRTKAIPSPTGVHAEQ